MIFIISYEFSVEYHMYIIFVYLFTQTVLPLLNRFRDGNDQGYIVICSSGVIVMRCAIWYHLHNLKNVKNTHGGAVLLVKVSFLHECFSRFLLHKWYQIAQLITYDLFSSETS